MAFHNIEQAIPFFKKKTNNNKTNSKTKNWNCTSIPQQTYSCSNVQLVLQRFFPWI